MQYWVEQMGQDIEQKKIEHREDMLQKELDRFLEHVMGFGQNLSGVGGGRPKPTTWSQGRNRR